MNQIAERAIGIPMRTSRGLLLSDLGSNGTLLVKKKEKPGKREDNFALRVREHMRLGPKIMETVKGKLSLGAKILQVGGVTKVFERSFGATQAGEGLLKASQCYLSTTAGPIAGLLFVSTDKVAFRSERSVKIPSPNGKPIKIVYKVVIPLRMIKMAHESKNANRPSTKYLEIYTEDGFDFWFMGFLNYRNTFKYLQLALSKSMVPCEGLIQL